MKPAIGLSFLILLAVKWTIAGDLDLFGDEAFYWQCSQRPALAYADHPPMTALLVGLGTEVLGDTTLGVRLAFLLLGAAIPLAVFELARPLVGRRDAWLAAGAAMIVPAFAHLGLLAVPDVPMVLLTTLFLLGLERATRSAAVGPWLLTGLVGALGLATHYRFVLAPLAACLYLALTRQGRRHWRGQGPWLLLIGLLPGLLPSILHNVRNGFEPLRYHLAGRHGTRFTPDQLAEHVAAQALMVSPLLYLALIWVLIRLCRRARAGETGAALPAIFALVHLGVFFVASPFESADLVTAHWPAPGYLALLPFLPAALRDVARPGRPWRRAAALAAPALGAVTTAVVLAGLGGWIQLGSIREPFVGWSEVAEQTRSHLLDLPPTGEGRLVVGDHYKLGANLEFLLHEEADVLVLDHPKNHKHGRARQFAVWGIGEDGLRRRSGADALLVMEMTQTRRGEHAGWLAHAESFFDGLEPVGELRLDSPGKRKKFKHFRFFRGRVVEPDDGPDSIAPR